MSWSDTTVSPEFENVCRTAVLEALTREEFSPASRGDATRIVFRPALMRRTKSESPSEFPYSLQGLWKFAAPHIGGSIDSSTDDPASRLIDRIIAATQHHQVISVLPLLGLREIADRLGYLHEISSEDPEEPPMALDSLRELALFLVSERQYDNPEIGISPDGILMAEWRVRGGGTLAMKFLPAGLIQFAAISRRTGDQQPLRVHGTLPKDRTLGAVQAFIRQGRP